MPMNKGQPMTVQVFSAGRNNHEEALTRTCPVKGEERKAWKQALKNTKPAKFQSEKIHKLDPVVALENNWQEVKSDDVLRKIKSEALSEDDLAKDPYFDIVLKRRAEMKGPENEIFIQEVAEPLHVFLYSAHQVKVVLNSFSSRHKIFVHFDATGSLVRPSNDDKKKQFTYTPPLLMFPALLFVQKYGFRSRLNGNSTILVCTFGKT